MASWPRAENVLDVRPGKPGLYLGGAGNDTVALLLFIYNGLLIEGLLRNNIFCCIQHFNIGELDK